MYMFSQQEKKSERLIMSQGPTVVSQFGGEDVCHLVSTLWGVQHYVNRSQAVDIYLYTNLQL